MGLTATILPILLAIVITIIAYLSSNSASIFQLPKWLWKSETETYLEDKIRFQFPGHSCHVLQEDRQSLDWWRPIDFVTSHAGKDLVEPILFNGVPGILKVPKLHLHLQTLTSTLANTGVVPFVHLTQWVLENYGHNTPSGFTDKFRSMDLAGLEEVHRRLQHEEFYFLSVLPFTTVPAHRFPKLLGLCGDGFMVERSGVVLGERFIREHGWEEAVKDVAMSFVDFATELDAALLEICDVKLDNFAWNPATKSVLVIDLDSMFFKEALGIQFASRQCRDNADCRYFDCRGDRCDAEAGMCRMEIGDSNLARICRKIFLPRFWQKGLFSAAPLVRIPGLFALAERCGRGGDGSELVFGQLRQMLTD
ncbi:hypothetical protein BV898_03963 [Hypsibius exemplaris]|uniref:FAM69 protein-kinase domain-containing protein n=1 Tax=Hypsibius exemplaris TaxID=2072580 RepID=A0A1W0X3I7_HYPEX|nr:hypothetical protein BV898_03963 [Hypsibius exemplaris]